MTSRQPLRKQPWWVQVVVLVATLWLLGLVLTVILALVALLGGDWSL